MKLSDGKKKAQTFCPSRSKLEDFCLFEANVVINAFTFQYKVINLSPQFLYKFLDSDSDVNVKVSRVYSVKQLPPVAF